MPATDGTWRAEPADVARASLPRRQIFVASVLFPLALGVFLLSRRLTGAMTAPLPPLPLAATALALVAWALAVLFAWRNGAPVAHQLIAGARLSPKSRLRSWCPPLTIVLFAVACSYPGDRLVDWFLWLPTIAVVGWLSRAGRPTRRRAPTVRGVPAEEHVLQEITRFRTTDGTGAIRGMLVAEFAAGQREATLFVAFCPPFEQLPGLEAELTEDVSATVKVTQCVHHGAQLEVRFAEPVAEDVRVSVRIFAGQCAAQAAS